MPGWSLTLARFFLSFWVGAATLFAVVTIRHATSGQFDSATMDKIALLKFPAYYIFGFFLVCAGTLCLLAARDILPRNRFAGVMGLLCLALLIMCADYFAIYAPMERTLRLPPQQARPAEFIALHSWSEIINSVHVGLTAIAAIWLNAPGRRF